MQETVSINSLTLCHKHSNGWVRSTLPDVCRSPDKPVPYTNTAYARDLAKGTRTVFSHDGAMNGVKGSEFYRSFGDEPGTGGGIKSGVNLHRATWLSWSPDVFMEGRHVTRLTDRMLLNKGNTISAGGYYTGVVQGPDRAILNKLCSYACDCRDAGTARQACVERAIMGDPTNVRDADNGLWPELTYQPDGSFARTRAGMPTRRRGLSGSRLDVSNLVDGKPVSIIEMKIGKDDYFAGQRERYEALAERVGADFRELQVEEECACSSNDNRQPAPVPASAAATAPDSEGNFVQRHPYWTAAGVLAAGALTWYVGGAGGAAMLAVAGGTAATAQ